MQTIQFKDNSEAVIAEVKRLLTVKGLVVTFEPAKPVTITALSGNSCEIMSNPSLVTPEVIIEFTGMGGYYTEYGVKALELLLNGHTHPLVGKKVRLGKVPVDWDFITSDIIQADGKVFTALGVDEDGDIEIDLKYSRGVGNHYIPPSYLTIVTNCPDLED